MSGFRLEAEARNVARARWNLPPGEGGAQFINGQEIDSVCETEDLVHLIMCTVSRKADKIRADVQKLEKASRYLQSRGKQAKLWEITKEEPTADQRNIARKQGVSLMSVTEFRRSLIDVPQYFGARSNYRFGSAVDPLSDSQTLPEDEYLPLPIVNVRSSDRESIASLCKRLEDGAVGTLIGDFGAGKSLTAREIFFELKRRYGAAAKQVLPIAINLREHWGQTDVEEVLTRHAQKLGYTKPNDLVRAWNAGGCVIILDGFDELAIQSLVNQPRTRRMARRAATQIIREFVASARGKSGVLITGRGHYFDSFDELRSGLSLELSDPIYELGVFTEEQAHQYLSRKGVAGRLPDWMPRTPLLLGYLASRRLLQDVSSIDTGEDPAEAWDQFLDRIAQRDSALGPDIDPATVRRLLERLATKTRLSVNGTRELDDADVSEAFREVTGVSPFDTTHVLLQRLPGLTSRTSQEGTRSFVDNGLLETLQASDVLFFLMDPYSKWVDGTLQHPLSAFGCEVLAYLSKKWELNPRRHVSAAREARNRWTEGTLALECLTSGALRVFPEALECEEMVVSDGYVDVLDLNDMIFSRLVVEGCAIEQLTLGNHQEQQLNIRNCLIAHVDGVTSRDNLPSWIEDSDVDNFDAPITPSSLLALDVPPPVSVALTIMRKIFIQMGRGRRENALRRGLDIHLQQHVNGILDVLRSHEFVWSANHSGNVVWYGNPAVRPRVNRILSSPLTAGDPIIPELAELD